jgi:hypothetical protein
MPSFGAGRQFARGQGSEKKLKSMTIRMPEARGREETVVEHEHQPPHPKEKFQFAPNENKNLAAHLSKHLGLRLPGKATGGDSAESEVSKADFE